MINLDDIKGSSAISLLEEYSGINPYILRLKSEYLKNNKIKLTDNQSKYVLDNYNREPQYINRIIGITQYLGEELKKQDNLSFLPEKILIEFILAETDKTFHVYGKLKQNQVESKMYWLPKTQLNDDPYFEPINIEVDFDKYDKILSKFDKKLFSHQKEAIKFLLGRNTCILGHEPGMGKTMSAIIAALESGSNKILIVTTSSSKINWKREIGVFCKDVAVVEGSKWLDSKFIVLNFDILKNFYLLNKDKKKKFNRELNQFSQLVKSNFDLVIIDEAHSIKDKDSIRGEILTEFCLNYNINRVWLMTGTPVANRPMDYFNLLKIIKSPIANNWVHFATRYCDGRQIYRTLKNGKKRKTWLTTGASNLEELANKTKNILLKGKKVDSVDMPDKMVIPRYYELSEKSLKSYNQLWDDYLEKCLLKGKKTKNLQKDLVELILLRQFIANETIPYTIELAEEAIENDRKIIIFTSFKEEQKILKEYFGKLAVLHNGEMNIKAKQSSIDNFQNDPNIKVFIGNIKSSGVAITLTAASVVIFNSFSWVPGENQQAEERSFRIGQKNDVTVYYQLFENTVSIRMWDTLNTKKDIISTIIGEKQKTEEEIIEMMMDKFILNEND